MEALVLYCQVFISSLGVFCVIFAFLLAYRGNALGTCILVPLINLATYFQPVHC